MNTYFVLCKTTDYGGSHTPLYVSSFYDFEKKNELQKLYDEYNKVINHPYHALVASIFEVKCNDLFPNTENWFITNLSTIHFCSSEEVAKSLITESSFKKDNYKAFKPSFDKEKKTIMDAIIEAKMKKSSFDLDDDEEYI